MARPVDLRPDLGSRASRIASTLLARWAEPRPVLACPFIPLCGAFFIFSKASAIPKEVLPLWTKAQSPESSWYRGGRVGPWLEPHLYLISEPIYILGLDLSLPYAFPALQLDSPSSPRREQGILGGPGRVLSKGSWVPGDKELESWPYLREQEVLRKVEGGTRITLFLFPPVELVKEGASTVESWGSVYQVLDTSAAQVMWGPNSVLVHTGEAVQ